MKQITFLTAFLFYCLPGFCQALSPGDQVPELLLPASISGKPAHAVSAPKGKIVILDFWATWCSPCIAAMKDLEKYKAALGDKLEVVAISDEPVERLQKFTKARPSTLDIVSDTARTLQTYFPHRTIPHTVLIGPEGKVYAITNADNITLEVLKLALKGVALNLPVKKDDTSFDLAEYLKADTTQKEYFSLLPPAVGVGTMSTTHNTGSLAGKRLSIINMPLDGLFRLAYEKSYYLVVNEYDTVKRAYADVQKYSLDAWIEQPDKKKLMLFIQQHLKTQ
ncbi:MAG: TlpA family protein disulfide reductase, partial [Chitinophagaceae bacterium]